MALEIFDAGYFGCVFFDNDAAAPMGEHQKFDIKAFGEKVHRSWNSHEGAIDIPMC